MARERKCSKCLTYKASMDLYSLENIGSSDRKLLCAECIIQQYADLKTHNEEMKKLWEDSLSEIKRLTALCNTLQSRKLKLAEVRAKNAELESIISGKTFDDENIRLKAENEELRNTIEQLISKRSKYMGNLENSILRIGNKCDKYKKELEPLWELAGAVEVYLNKTSSGLGAKMQEWKNMDAKLYDIVAEALED